MNERTIEQEIQDKGIGALRVTPDDIEDNILSEYYFTADEGVLGAYKMNDDVYVGTDPFTDTTATALKLLTFCVIVLKNGFTVTGESACVSPENFYAEIGRKIARQRAVDKIYPLIGYELKCRLAERA